MNQEDRCPEHDCALVTVGHMIVGTPDNVIEDQRCPVCEGAKEILSQRGKISQLEEELKEVIGVANELGAHFDRLATGMGLQMTAEDLVDYILDNKERLL